MPNETDETDEDDYFEDEFNPTDPSKTDQETDSLEFMACVVKVIFRIAYCYQSTKEICHKEGNSLLFAICSAYPKLIGIILDEIDLNLDKIGKKALYLSNELPFNKWLACIDCKKDINFLEKCLLQTATNSILFCIATNCIDHLDLKQSTKQLSHTLIGEWEARNNCSLLGPNQQGLDVIDLGRLIQIKLAIILYELHLRLTIYNYFNKSTCESLLDGKAAHTDELASHYSRLNKEKRVSIVNWIWSTLTRMNLFTNVGSSQLVDYLDKLSNVYSATTVTVNRVLNSHLNSLLNHIALNSVLEPKCPLEKYLNLVFSCTPNSDLGRVFEEGIELIQFVLTTHKKQSRLQQLSYTLVFAWFENLVFKYATVRLRKTPNAAVGQYQATSASRLNEFRLAKQENIQKLSALLLIIFNPNASNSNAIIDAYCQKIINRLNKFNAINCFNSNNHLKPQTDSSLNRYNSKYIKFNFSRSLVL